MLKEATEQFAGKTVIEASGYADIDMELIAHHKILDIKTWGKHYLICFKGFTIRIHLMLFGSYLINERKKVNAKLSLAFKKDELNFYTCDVRLIEGDINEVYDWSADIMADEWSSAKAKKKLMEKPDMLICDALMDQNIFSGSGNIIKNEVMFRIRVHPESRVGALPAKQMKALLSETRKYAFDFLNWKRKKELNKHLQVYEADTCPRCNIPLHKRELGKSKRQTYYCTNCQELFT
jgi:endonuclease-8